MRSPSREHSPRRRDAVHDLARSPRRRSRPGSRGSRGTTGWRRPRRARRWAIASRSSVVTPGAAASRIASQVAADHQPGLGASAAISSARLDLDLARGRPRHRPSIAANGCQRVDRALGDVLDGAESRRSRPAARGRRRTRSAARSARRRPRAGAGRCPAGRRRAGRGRRRTCRRRRPTVGRIELDVPDVAALLAGAPPGQPADDLVVVDLQFEHDVEGGPEVGEDAVELVGLRHVAREPVEQEAVGRRPARPAGRAPSRW